MTAIFIVPIYSVLLGLVFLILSMRVISIRRQEKIILGDDGNSSLIRAMRAQANFAEYTPFILLLLAFAELRGIPWFVIHPLCILLLSGRCLHAYGFSQQDENIKFRVFGMHLTFWTLILSLVSVAASYFLELFFLEPNSYFLEFFLRT